MPCCRFPLHRRRSTNTPPAVTRRALTHRLRFHRRRRYVRRFLSLRFGDDDVVTQRTKKNIYFFSFALFPGKTVARALGPVDGARTLQRSLFTTTHARTTSVVVCKTLSRRVHALSLSCVCWLFVARGNPFALSFHNGGEEKKRGGGVSLGTEMVVSIFLVSSHTMWV